MGKIAKDEFFVLCDDIRDEIRNKRSLMGAYSGNIIVNKMPVTLSKMCVYVFLNKIKRKFENIHIQIIIPKSKVHKLEMKAPAAIDVGKNISLGIILSPLKIEGEGNSRIELKFDDDEKPSIIYRFEITVEKN